MGADLERLVEGLRAALEDVGLRCFVLDTEGLGVWANRAMVELVGPVAGRHFSDVLAPEDALVVSRRFADKVGGRRDETTYVVDLHTFSGSRRPMRVVSVPLRSGGAAVGVFGVVCPLEPRREPREDGASRVHLTGRQRQVLTLLGQGRTTREIADELGIALETVRNHIRHLLRELGARSRLEAVVTAHRLGLLDDAEGGEAPPP